MKDNTVKRKTVFKAITDKTINVSYGPKIQFRICLIGTYRGPYCVICDA